MSLLCCSAPFFSPVLVRNPIFFTSLATSKYVFLAFSCLGPFDSFVGPLSSEPSMLVSARKASNSCPISSIRSSITESELPINFILFIAFCKFAYCSSSSVFKLAIMSPLADWSNPYEVKYSLAFFMFT